MSEIKPQQIKIRNADFSDISDIYGLSKKVYGKLCLSEKMLKGQISNFSAGQFIVENDGKIIGHCATFIIDEKSAFAPHNWGEITGNGYGTRHNPDGDYLYGMDICVDPDYRGLRIGQRLYNARKKLCQELDLKGIVFAGRLPGYAKKKGKVGSPQEYLKQVIEKKLRDPVVGFQLRNDFEPIGILEKYLPSDSASEGFAAHMVWKNPLYSQRLEKQTSNKMRSTGQVRIASVQFQARKVESFEGFMNQVEYFVDIASDYRSDFVLFPELFTMPLLSAEKKRIKTHAESVRIITQYTEQYVTEMREMAKSYNINIIGGSHPTMVDEKLKNISYIFLRGGEVHQQTKIHPTPNERYWWHMQGGDHLNMIQTDCGPIGVLICYDAEFPELARHLADQGALLLFVPFCTDERKGYLRVRHCAQARAIENQMYVATAGIVGNLPDVENMDIHYAESHIFTPCDFPFARDGIAAEAAANTEAIIFADVNMNDLLVSRHSGTVQNFKDRRFDLYEVTWKK